MARVVPYIGFSDETLDGLPFAEPGELVTCPRCGAQHPLDPSVKWPGGTTTAGVMFYKCGEEMMLGAVRSRLVVGVEPDVSSSNPKHLCVICAFCWKKHEPGRDPIRLREPVTEICCWCGGSTRSGIYRLSKEPPLCCPRRRA